MTERARASSRAQGRFAVKLRTKIFVTILGVALGVAAVGIHQTQQAALGSGRGRFLEPHYKRFDAYRRGLGKDLAAVAGFVAQDPAIVAAVRGPRPAGPDGVVPPFDADSLTRAAQALEDALEMDLVVFLDAHGNPLTGADGLSGREASRSALVRDVLSGMSIEGELAVLPGGTFQVSAAPIRAGGDVVGGIVLGIPLERYFDDYRQQSDTRAAKQHYLTLVGTDGQILASVFPNANEQLAEASEEGNWRRAPEGRDAEVPVLEVSGKTYDFWMDAGGSDAGGPGVIGYHRGDKGPIGRIFLLRTREAKEAELAEALRDAVLPLLASLVLALLAGFFMTWTVSRRISRYVAATADIAQGGGDLTQRIEVEQHDELGELAENLNAIFQSLQDLATGVQRAAFQVGASSAEISAASKHMLDGAQEQARKTEGSTAAVTELSASIQQVAENASEATRVARSSGQAVRKAIERMNEIRTAVDEAASRMQELGDSGKRIGNIVEVIRQISDQTTLLALNAAIEAAHAGEQGRGFAVVADEVSGLANRVGQSARDIEDLIATIKEQTVEAVRAMEAGTREVEEGTRLVSETLADLQTLGQVVEDTASAVSEQAVASDEIARNMDIVQRIAQDVLSSSEEAVEQGEHLHRLAHGLEESVKGFHVSGRLASENGDSPAALPPITSDRKSGRS